MPVPLIIEKANESSIESITKQIANAREEKLTDKDIVLQRKTSQMKSYIIFFRDLSDGLSGGTC